MATPSKMKKVTLSALAALGATAGAAGIAAAATSQSTPTDRAPAAEQPAGDQSSNQGPEHDDTTNYKSSITVPQSPESANEDDAAEQAKLEKLAKISADDAVTAATAAVPGKAGPAELDDEDGNLVYEVEVTKADNSSVEVIIDAGNGEVLAQETDDDDADDAAEQAELAKLAKVSADDAVTKATAAVPGTAGPAELDEENGKVVYEVEIIKADGTEVDVIIDAINGDVIAQETDDDSHEANEAPEGTENNTEAPTTTQGN